MDPKTEKAREFNIDSLIEKVPPYSTQAEMAVLGCMLIEKDALENALENLSEDDFYNDAYKKIFSVVKVMSEQNRAIDILTLAEEMKNINYLENVGGFDALTKLTDSVVTAAHIGEYVRIVQEKAVLRSLIRAATSMVTKCFSQNEEPDALLDDAESAIYQIAEKKHSRLGLLPIKDMLQETIEKLETLHQNKNAVTGVATGFKELDKMTAGFQPGNLVILAARPGVGKTSFALNIAIHAAVKNKLPVALFSLEMSEQEIVMRLLSAVSGIPLGKLRTGFFQKSDWPLITRKAEILSESPIHLDYSSSAVSILTLRAAARRLSRKLAAKGTPLSLIIIDYLQLMQGSRRNPESRQTEIAEISRSLKGLARDLNIPIVALSQLNRSPEERGRDGKPQLSDLRESGAIEQDADVVAFIYREGLKKIRDDMDPEERTRLLREAKLMVAKQRNGPLGEIDLVFMGECARFGDPAVESFNE